MNWMTIQQYEPQQENTWMNPTKGRYKKSAHGMTSLLKPIHPGKPATWW